MVSLFRESFAILFCPGTIRRDWLHGRSTLSSTGTRPFHLGFSHAGTGLRLQAGANVNDLAFCLGLVLRVGRGLIARLTCRTAARRQERQQNEGKNGPGKSRSVIHGSPPPT